MPSFHSLPDGELDSLAAYIRFLNSTGAESTIPGTPAAGRDFFFGKGQCANCHRIDGKGKAIGPDLSNVWSRDHRRPKSRASQ